MARHRSPSGSESLTSDNFTFGDPDRTTTGILLGGVSLKDTSRYGGPGTGAHRIPTPPPAARGRIVISAVAAGAFVAAGVGQYLQGGTGDRGVAAPSRTSLDQSLNANTASLSANTQAPSDATGVGGAPGLTSPDILLSAKTVDPASEARKLEANQRAVTAVQAQRARAAAERNRPKYVRPAAGNYTSGFEARWGSFHYGVDIANVPDTPILAAADGEIIEAGPASGFGLWVREKLDDGTILVYGHMDDFSVHAGQRVKAGEQIARMGNRGESTGYHLHFEVWEPGGKKIDPHPWLSEHGVDL